MSGNMPVIRTVARSVAPFNSLGGKRVSSCRPLQSLQSSFILRSFEHKGPEALVAPDALAVRRGSVWLLEVAPDDAVVADLDPADQGPAARLATLTNQHLDLVVVSVHIPHRITEEVLRGRTRVPVCRQAGVLAGDLGRAFPLRVGPLLSRDPVHQILTIDEDPDFTAPV